MKEVENLITVVEIDDVDKHHVFVDFKESGPEIYEKEILLENKIDENDLKKELFERIEKLSNPYDPIEESNENINTKIKWGSNWIATVGRFGYATHLLISKENYEKHEIDSLYLVSDVDPIKINPPLLTIVFSDNVKDCILYRINSFDQPGLVLVHNNDKYSFESIGFYPENQFLRILLK